MEKISLGKLIGVFVTSLLMGCSVAGIRSGYEQLGYTVVEKIGDVEIRQYPARLAAEAEDIKGDDDAFMLLFRYISGANVANAKVAMTSPVEVTKESAKIAMTSPVEVSKSGEDTVKMRFFLPTSFNAETAPKPSDPRIKIVSLPAETLAVITYSGIDTEGSFKRNSTRLSEALSGSAWKSISSPTFFGYDPPWTIPFLRRNEVIVKVESVK